MPASDSSLVFAVHEYGRQDADKVVLFFCPFGISSWQLALPGMPIRHLRKAGYTVISYSYRTVIATKSLKLTIDNIEAMVANADQRIDALDPEAEIICFGTSMGTLMAANVAARHKRIKKVILNLSYADISDHIIALPSIRAISSKQLKAYLATAGSEEDLRAAFDPYSPLTLVEQFRGKKLLVYASRNDRILKLVHTTKFHVSLRKAGVDLCLYQNNRGGHYFAALVNYLRYHRWMGFLQES